MPTADEPILPKPTPLWRKFLGNTLVRSGAILVGLLIALAVSAPVIAPYDRIAYQYPKGLNADGMPLPPSRSFPLGTDGLGRDVLVRLLYGSRISLTVGIAAMLAAVAFGVVIGLYSGYYGGWVDVVLMRFTDVMMAIPALLLALALAGLMNVGRTITVYLPGLRTPLFEFKLERGLIGILIVIGVVSWTGIARVVRGQVLALKERAFVEAARAIGCSSRRILWRHLLPNVLPAIIVLCGHEYGRHHRTGSRPQLPRPRRTGAGAVVGHDDKRRAALLHRRAVARAGAGHCHRSRRPRFQSARSRIARRDGPLP